MRLISTIEYLILAFTGSCSNENCPYRHVNVNKDSTVCESFLRGYCADGNEVLLVLVSIVLKFRPVPNCEALKWVFLDPTQAIISCFLRAIFFLHFLVLTFLFFFFNY